ncbi:MAG: S8 family peptidase [Chitinophagaceae bacterium]
MRTFFTLTLVFSTFLFGIAQPSVPGDSLKGWHLKDFSSQQFAGISLSKAYEQLKNRKSNKIIVAVIDSGIDTLHEDLKPVLWRNSGEIPGNGIDDDKNGYVDDYYGWNFIGGKDGRNIEKCSAEKSRLYHNYKEKFEGKTIDTNQLSFQDKVAYMMWQKAAAAIEPEPGAEMQVKMMERVVQKITEHEEIIRTYLQKQEFTTADVEESKPAKENEKKAKMGYLNLMKMLPLDKEITNTFIMQELNSELSRLQDESTAKTKAPYDYRSDIVKDNYFNIKDKFYGNADVMGKSSMHGTHVSGIIGAVRNNQIGVAGVADNVQLMTIRAVPDGDEYDKDIALAVRYAVDNGAKVINMSFGKSFSPEKYWVDEAFEYAAQKDVLLIHAAGNDHKNVDSLDNFPSNTNLKGKIFANLITVGASSDEKVAGNYAANFSNYGQQNVDVFAPGNQIYSTLPGGNKYGFLDGTSMASPVVAGLAALIRSYFPTLTAVQVKKVIEESVMPVTEEMTVYKPGTQEAVKMKQLCKTGGIVNAYQAVKMAKELAVLEQPTEKQSPSNLPKKSTK